MPTVVRGLLPRIDMRIAIAVIALLAGCVVEPATQSTDQPIIGGQTTSTTTYKTVVDLETSPGQWFCTGTLIDKDWVLTAAHCVSNQNAGNVKIRFDADNINNGSQGHTVAVAEIHVDPQFNGQAWDNDIAVIKLAASATDRAPTPVHRTAVTAGATVTQLGYGDSDNNGNGGGTLRKLDTPTVDCAQANDSGISNANLLCFNAHDGTTSCYGDSGGPAFVTGSGGLEIAGLASGGTSQTCTQGWDLYTSVSAEIAFVDQYVPVVTVTGGGDGGGSGSGSGSGSGGGTDGGTDGGTGGSGGGRGSGSGSGRSNLDVHAGGCSTGGDVSVFVAAAVLVLARRRRIAAARVS